jgi:hypothetical protein
VRWSYKNIHFGLKKDGLLGSAFLDDAEIEETLNEYGQSGWELVSMFETRDGVLAVFKQPMEAPPIRQAASYGRREEQEKVVAPVTPAPVRKPQYRNEDQLVDAPKRKADYREEPELDEQYPMVDEEIREPEVMAKKKKHADEDEDGDSGIGSIRIE